MAMKIRTQGIDPKVPIQALATVIAFVATYFSLNIDGEVALAIAVVLGGAAGYFGPAPKTVLRFIDKKEGTGIE